jgi:hypothetical protein
MPGDVESFAIDFSVFALSTTPTPLYMDLPLKCEHESNEYDLPKHGP